MGMFTGKVALITGGGSGIGKATALAFGKEGAKVVVADLPGPAGEETAAEIRAAGGEAKYLTVDVSDDASVAALIDGAVKAYGRIDAAFNNAGVNFAGDNWEDLESFDRTMDVNVTGVARCIRYEVRQMKAQGGGAIVNTASINGLVGSPQAGYVTSKHAVVGITRSAALAFARDNIRVNAVCPGTIKTAMTAKFDNIPHIREAIENMTPMGRMGQPEEIASAVLWLCSPGASFVTGHPLVVDGGVTAQ